ncbi:MAG: hypothetical protein AMS24_02970 [Chlamydiae bacterium SM23_39]|nr:MAG: hypothetical protein AMS24_02970 [Chlamydiae bacterium SM23_39]
MKKGRIKYFSILVFSIFFSLIIHFGVIFFLYKHFLSFYKTICSDFKGKKVFMDEDKILSFTFDLKSVKNKKNGKVIARLIPERERKIIISKEIFSSKIDKISSNFKYQGEKYLKEKKLLGYEKKEFIIDREIKNNFQNIVSDLKKNIFHISKKEKIDTILKTYPLLKLNSKNIYLDNKIDLPKEKISYKIKLDIDVEKKIKNIFFKLKEKMFKIKGEKKFLFPYKTIFPSLKDLNTISLNDEFELNVEYVKIDDGYVFAIILIPNLKYDRFKRLKQNFWFLIDSSNSIQNKRLNITRQAVQSSLSILKKEDDFNIFTFDNKMKLLFSNKKRLSNSNISRAKKFLMEMTLGSFFSSTNFFIPFNRISKELEEEDINNVIFLSNGEGWNKYKHRRLIKNWTDSNKDFASLYTLALAEDKDTSILDIFSSLNRGKLITSTTLRGIKRHLFKLIKNLEYPISKDVTTKIYGEDIELFYPQKGILYLSQPFILLGKSDKLEDFTIFIQGKNIDKWINIKKKISFDNTRKGTLSLEKKWAKSKAQKYYNLYLAEEDVVYLKKAEKILKPLNISTAFR